MEKTISRVNSDDALTKLIQTINNNYIHWDKFKDMQLPAGFPPEEVWQLAQKERMQGFTRRLSVGTIDITWWLSNSMEGRLHQLDVDLAGGRDLHVLSENKEAHRHKTNALVEESIASAQTAGAAVTKKAAREMLLKKRPPRNANEQACINIYRALLLALSKKEEPLSETLLLQLHQTLTKDIIQKKGIGRYRTNTKVDESSINFSAGYTLPNAKEIPRLIASVVDFYNNNTLPFFIHPLVKSGIIHYLITAIRPFKDANGRIARLMSEMYLWKNGYWVTEFLAPSNVISKLKTQYHKSIVQSQLEHNNISYFIQFYVQSLQMAQRSLKDFLQRTARVKKNNTAALFSGYNERQTDGLLWLKEDAEKVVTIRELRSVYGISKETARTDLTGLVHKGWLKYYHINKKTYAFVKGDAYEDLMRQYG